MRAQIQINYNFNMNSSIQSLDSFSEQSNVSNGAQIIASPVSNFKGFKGFHFAQETGKWPAIADGTYNYYPDEGYKGYISRVLSDAQGNINVTLQLTIAGSIPDAIYIIFDQICNEFATNLIISNSQNSNVVTINNRRYIARIPIDSMNLTASDDGVTITITIKKWNLPFKGVKITKISLNYVGIYDTNELVSFETSENLLNQQLQISAGICEQYANVSIYDRSGMIREFAKMEILSDEQSIDVFAIDDDTVTEYHLGSFNIKDWDVQSTNSTIKLTATDVSQTLDKLYVSMLPVKKRSVDELLTMCFSQLKNTSWKYIDDDTKVYCENIETPNSWCYTGTLLDTLIKVCLLGMLRIYYYIDSFIVARCY